MSAIGGIIFLLSILAFFQSDCMATGILQQRHLASLSVLAARPEATAPHQERADPSCKSGNVSRGRGGEREGGREREGGGRGGRGGGREKLHIRCLHVFYLHKRSHIYYSVCFGFYNPMFTLG